MNDAAAWLAPALLWLVGALLVLGAVCAWLLWRQHELLAQLGGRLAALDHLAEIERATRVLADARGDLDLRRVEHVLVDIRDAQRRVEDALLRSVERTSGDAAPAAPNLADAITNRLLALGYDRVQLAGTDEELGRLALTDGDVLVEARKSGVAHKGRVLVRGGRIHAVEIQPPFAVFP
ncbi:MAG: hypothetical protein EPO68_08785 [Planctomycetota bacterium]|nr:MAG: hypothetical protein EPO68_08785 [Planctomycetota bacterium]